MHAIQRHRMPARIVSVALGAVLLLLLPAHPARAEFAATNDWPEEILTEEGKVLVYQPQLESLEGDTLTGRAAISFTPIGGEPTFGAFWFEGKLRTDRDSRTYTLEKIKVPGVKFPELDPESAEKTARLLEKEIPKWNIHGSLDAILPALELAKKEQSAVEQLRTVPPKIVFSMRPSVLLLYDGKPRVRPVEGSDLKRAENTPFFVVQDAAGGWYLNLGEFWYGAPDPAGTWKAGANPPDSVRKLQEREAARAEGKAGGPKAEKKASPVKDAEKPVPPEIIVATEPTELLQTDGGPKYASLPGNELLFVENTASDLFLPIGTQKHFALLSGRWFATHSLAGGPWEYVAPDKLPPEFRKIPADSPKGHVLASVAGTDAANEAVLDTYIPQTSAIKREKNAKVGVIYDGEPKFEPIKGTPLSYAVNTGSSVLRHEDRFYLCDQAVWYVSASPKGPWAVATSIPKEIQAIPPEYPVYNVKYVYIYDSTPEVVYVGYTPGYNWAYPYYGTVVYGTGYYYPGWYGNYYYPYPVTYGFNAVYNPYTCGWGFGVGIGIPGFGFYWGAPGYWYGPGYGYGYGYGYGWWGPAGYRPPPYYYYGGYYPPGGYRPGYRPPGYPPGIGRGIGLSTRPVRRSPPAAGRGRRHGTISTRARGTSTGSPPGPVLRPGPRTRPVSHRRPGGPAPPHRSGRQARRAARRRPGPPPGEITSTPTRAAMCIGKPLTGGSSGDRAAGTGPGEDPVLLRARRLPWASAEPRRPPWTGIPRPGPAEPSGRKPSTTTGARAEAGTEGTRAAEGTVAVRRHAVVWAAAGTEGTRVAVGIEVAGAAVGTEEARHHAVAAVGSEGGRPHAAAAVVAVAAGAGGSPRIRSCIAPSCNTTRSSSPEEPVPSAGTSARR